MGPDWSRSDPTFGAFLQHVEPHLWDKLLVHLDGLLHQTLNDSFGRGVQAQLEAFLIARFLPVVCLVVILLTRWPICLPVPSPAGARNISAATQYPFAPTRTPSRPKLLTETGT
jgi:hypothetical protein